MLKLKPDDPRSLGSYTITDVIGEGGMGRVYLGHLNGKLVAVKVMSGMLAADPTLRSRFRREIDAAKLVRGGFTAEVLEAGSKDGVLWFASEYIPGLTLTEAVRLERFDKTALVELGFGLCKALKAIHAAGIIHRDIKPSNTILSPTGVKVVDFGIAAVEGAPALTRTGEVPGTVSYLSYEQARGMKVTTASDVFALGSVLAFAATGSPPFTGPNSNAIMTAIADPSVRPNLARVPADMVSVIAGCLVKNPRTRSTLAQVEQALAGMRKTVVANQWLPPTVVTKVEEATKLMTARQELLAPTRVAPQPAPKPAPKVAKSGKSPWYAVSWVGTVAALAGALWYANGLVGDNPTEAPEPKPTVSTMPTVEVPPPTFTASKLKATGNMAVTKVVADDRRLYVYAQFDGSDEQKEDAFTNSCLRVFYKEGSHVQFKPGKPEDVAHKGAVVFGSALDFPGNIYFFAKCPKENGAVGGQWLGKNKVANDGFFGNGDIVMPVVDAYTKGDKLKVVLPAYIDYTDREYNGTCLKTAKGAKAYPTSLARAVNGKRTFVVLTYNHKRGTIYVKCSGDSFTGKGTAIP